jgi:histone H3/H4
MRCPPPDRTGEDTDSDPYADDDADTDDDDTSREDTDDDDRHDVQHPSHSHHPRDPASTGRGIASKNLRFIQAPADVPVPAPAAPPMSALARRQARLAARKKAPAIAPPASFSSGRAVANKQKQQHKQTATVRRLPAGVAALRSIRKYQQSTELLLRRAPMERLAREIVQDLTTAGVRWGGDAVEALQTGTEAFAIELLQKSGWAALHGRRVTAMRKDVALVAAVDGATAALSGN